MNVLVQNIIRTYFISFFCTFLSGGLAFASPALITYQGKISNSDGSAYLGNAQFRFSILADTNPACVIYRETHANMSLASSKGVFNLDVGSIGSPDYKSPTITTLHDAFKNLSSFQCEDSSTFTPNTSSSRSLKVEFHDGNSWQVLDSTLPINSVPYASSAMDASKLGGFAASSFLQKPGAACASGLMGFDGTALTCTPISSLAVDWTAVTGKPTTFAPSAHTHEIDAITSASGKYFTYMPNNVACATNEILKWDGTRWICGTDNAGAGSAITALTGDVTASGTGSVAATVANVGGKTAAQVASAVDSIATVSTTYLAKAGGTMTGAVDMNQQNLTNVGHLTMYPSKTLHLSNNASSPAGSFAGADSGKFWYNSVSNKLEYWNGSAVKVVGEENGAANSAADLTSISGTGLVQRTGAASYSTLGVGSDFVITAGITLNLTDTGVSAGSYSKVTVDAKGRVTSGTTLAASDIPNLEIDKIVSAAGKYFTYAPNNVACANGEILKKTSNGWECGTAGSGTVTSITAGTGLTGGAITASGTIGLGAELAAVNAISTTGYIQRTGAGAYSTTAGNIAASNSTVVTRDGSGVSGFYGVGVQGSTAGTATIQAPTSFTNYSLTLPVNAGTNGQVLQTNGSGVLSWATPASGADNLGNHTATANIQLGSNWLSGDGDNEGITVDSSGKVGIGTASPSQALSVAGNISSTRVRTTFIDTDSDFNSGISGIPDQIDFRIGGLNTVRIWSGAMDTNAGGTYSLKFTAGTAAAPSYAFTADTSTGLFPPASNTLGISTDGTERMRIDSVGNVGIGTTSPNAKLDVKGALRLSGSTSGYAGFQPAAAAGSTVWTLPTADGTSGQVLTTNGTGILSWSTPSSTPADSSYAAKGVVQFNSDAATSGISVASGVASVNSGTAGGAGDANKIPKLNGSGVLATAMIPGLPASQITSGTLGVARGGTGLSSGTSGGVVFFDSTSTMNSTAAATSNGQVLRWNGSTWAPNHLSMFDLRSTITGAQTFGGGSAGCTSNQTLTWTSATDNLACTNISLPASQITGTLPIANGGTNNGSLAVTAGGVIYSDGSKLMNVGAGTSGQVLTSAGAGAPTWTTLSGTDATKLPLAGGTMTGAILASTTTASAPSFSFAGDTTTGMYQSQTSTIMFSVGNSEKARFNVNGFRLPAGSAANPSIGDTSSGSYGIFFPGSAIALSTAGTERVRIDSSGNVGIGTTSPGTNLHVRKDNNGETAVKIENQNAGSSAYSGINFANDVDSGSYLYVGSSTYTNLASRSRLNLQSGSGISGITLQANAGDIRLYTGANERVRVDGSGNVGIGTTSPSERLDVAGSIKATGQISSGSQTISGGTNAIDWNNGNTISTDYDCASSFAFANLKDGGTYTLVVTGTGTTQCNFSTSVTGTNAGTVSYRFKPANAARTASSHTIYTLLRVGNVVYVSYGSGF